MGNQIVRDTVGAVVVSVPVVNKITDNGIVTALELEQVVVFGMTWGAWFQVGMGIALTLLIVERALSIRNKLKDTHEEDK
jgi:hypothetical protein